MENALPQLREMQANLYLCKLPPAYTDAHLLLNEQINASISRELNRKGIRIDEINGKKLDQIIKRENDYRQNLGRESEFDPFYYFRHELDQESVAQLKSNDWKLHVDFQEHFDHQERVYADITEQLSRLHQNPSKFASPSRTTFWTKFRRGSRTVKRIWRMRFYWRRAKRRSKFVKTRRVKFRGNCPIS